MSIARKDLIGAWRLVSWQISYADGRTAHPFGADAEGLLIYSADGWMSAAMWKRRRSPLSAASALQADVASKARVLEEYLSYCGRWRLEGDCVVHDVVGSVNPTLIGTQQRREAQCLADWSLDLTAREEDPTRGARIHRIRWRRAD